MLFFICIHFFFVSSQGKLLVYMRIVRNRLIPPKRFDAINLFGVLFCRDRLRVTEHVIRHESIHTAQMREMLFVGFYIWYLSEWLVRVFMKGNAYHNISLEREAYAHMHDDDYLTHRRPYAWVKYLGKKRKKGKGKKKKGKR